MGAKIKTPKIFLWLSAKPQKSMHQTKKFHAKFPSLKNFQKVLDIKTVNKMC